MFSKGKFDWKGSYFDYLNNTLNRRDKNFVPLSRPDLPESDIKLIAFYLPQFHPIPENDEWWGKGFTEWTNVTRAIPQFIGHYQPRLPGELGFYDLRNPEIQERQLELARQYGIHGFCFHFYWFGGKRLLEKPLAKFISNPAIDFPFCINWANENWSRRWDGKDTDLLITQKHSSEDDIAFIQYVSKYLKQPNYIKINSKPLLILYRPALLPDPAKTAERWRKWCMDNGIGEIYLALTHAFERLDPKTIGFDAAIEFAPNTFPLSDVRDRFDMVNPTFGGRVFDYYDAVDLARNYRKPYYKKFRGICPGWDNEARRPGKSVVLANSSPDAYREWLRILCEFTVTNFAPEERLIFINAWNEWAEGAYLEPDHRYGYAYLHATANGLAASRRKLELSQEKWKILFVSHDAAVGGAQSVLLDIISWVKNHTFIDVKILCLQDGDWLYRFKEVGETFVLNELASIGSDRLRVRQFSDFCNGPVDLIYCNSVASGKAYHLLRSLNAPMIMHFHELEMSIERYASHCIDDVLKHSSHFVACSVAVRENLLKKYGVHESKISTIYSSIRPDYSIKIPTDPEKCEMKKSLGLEEKTFIVFGCGLTMAFRKGADMFIEVARILRKKGLVNFRFLWVGGFDEEEIDEQGNSWSTYLSAMRRDGLEDYVTFLGIKYNPREYFRAGDIFLITSRNDPFPLVALEAAECGLPIICFANAGGMPDFVENDAGFVVPFADAEAMAEKVVALMKNKDMRRQFGSQAREKLLQKFTPDQTAPHVLSLCRTVAKKKPIVSVIVPNFNHARYLPDRLDSIFNQKFKDIEVIVLDDASSDNSIDVIEKYKDRADVRVIRNEKNSGSPFPQWLKGIDLARADILWIAESDDFSDPRFLDTLLPSFERPDVKIAYTDSYVIDENSRVIGDYANGEYLTSLSQTKWKKSYQVSATTEINDGLGIKNTILNISAVLFRKVDLNEEFMKTLDTMRIAGDWYFLVHAIEGGTVFFDDRKLNFHRRHSESIIGKMVSEKKLEDFFREFFMVQEFIVSSYKLHGDFYEKWENYLRKQWNDFCPNRSFEELKAYYPLDMMKEKILANVMASEKDRLQETAPAVSIIIPLFNNLELTKKCLSSLTDNTSPDKYELIIVDNGSTDGTGNYLDSLDGQIKVIRNEQNRGFAAACNQGAQAALADYLLFLNNDTELLPAWIEPLIAILDNDSSVAASGSKLLFPDGTIQHAGIIVIDDRKLPDPLVARHIYYQQPATLQEANNLVAYQALTAACLMVRKSVFEEVGGFDEEYWNGYEDIDLCFKIQQKGWKLVYQPESVVIHHESKSGPERFEQVSKNVVRLHNKWLGKIKPDIIVERDGSVIRNDAEKIKPYYFPEPAESKSEEVRPDVQKKLTSIIILTHNQLEDTKACLESIRENTPEPCEIIVVDNGSTDSTVDYLREQVSKFKDIWVIRNNSNRGFAAGCNQGISVAEGEYILLLNNDTVVTEGWLSRMLDVFRRHTETGIVGPMSNHVAGLQLVADVPYKDLDQMKEFAAAWSSEHYAQSFPIYRVVGFCLLAKKEVIQKIGGLDERFGSGNFEDDDFCIRASLSGYESRVAQDVYIHHTGSRTFKGVGIDYKKSLLNNWKLLKDKWGIPVDTQYEEGYDLPLQPPPGLNVYIPLPDVLIDHQAEDSDGRWVIDVSSKEKQLRWTPNLTSIIVLTSNQFAHTKKCIKSLRKDTPEPHEIIVVDNGSSQKMTGWLRKQEHENRDVKLIGNPQGSGYAKACNLAINQSSGEYIAILTDNVVVSKGWLQGMLECLKASPDAGIIGPMTTNVEGPQNVMKTDYNSPDNLDRFAGAFREKYRYRRIPSRYLADCCMFFRHELLEKTGLFDEDIDFTEFAADDFCFRAALEGYMNIIAADVFIHLHADMSSQEKKEAAAALSLRKRNLFIQKWSKTDKETELKLSALNAIQTADEMSQKGMLDNAVGALMGAIKLNTADKRLYYTLAEILMDNMKFTEAQGVLQSLPERIRQEPCWFELAAKCSAAMQSYQEAEEYADKVLAMNNASAAALNIKGLVALKKGLNAEAEKFFEKALKADRGFAEAYTNIGRIKWPSKQEAAFALFEKAFILAPFLSDVAMHYYNAVVSLSRFQRAENIFRAATALYPMNKRLRLFLKEILLRTGRHAEAMEINEANIESE